MMKTDFDYTNVPEKLLFCPRLHLDDFGVDDSALNGIIQDKLFDKFASGANYEVVATMLFNYAYYMCTVALADKHPDRRFGTLSLYTEKALKYNEDYFESVLSIVLLQIKIHHWDTDSKRMKRFADLVNEKLLRRRGYNTLFDRVKTNLEKLHFVPSDNTLPARSEFTPRPVTYRLLKEVWSQMKWLYRGNGENADIDEYKDTLLEFIFAIGKDEKEQQVIANFMRDQLIKSFENGQEHKWFFDGIDREIHDLYHGEEDRARDQAEFEAYQEQETLKELEAQWNKERVIEQEAKIVKLEARIKQLEENTTISEDVFDDIFPSNENQQKGEEQSENPEQEQIIKTLQEEVERLRSDIEAYRNQGKGFTSSEAALFLIALCHHHRQIPQNGRENLAPLMTKIWGFTDTTSRAALRSKITQERADKLAKHIKSWAPAIASIITKIPPILEQENIERLKAQNPKKKNC